MSLVVFSEGYRKRLVASNRLTYSYITSLLPVIQLKFWKQSHPFTCSKVATEILEQGVKYVQS